MSSKPTYLRVQNLVTKAWGYWPWPLNGLGRLVNAFEANVQYRQGLPASETQLLAALPNSAIVATPAETEGLQGDTNQNNRTSDYLITEGFTQDQFSRAEDGELVAVINKRDLPYYNAGTKKLEIIESLGWEAVAGRIVPYLESAAQANFSFTHYDEVDAPELPTDANLLASVEIIDCQQVTGWLANADEPNTVQEVGLTCDGKIVVWAACQDSREDVRLSLESQGVKGALNTIFGFRLPKPPQYRDGFEHIWDIVARTPGTLKVNYFVPKNLPCPPPPDGQPYVVGYIVTVPGSLTKGGAGIVATLNEKLNTGQVRPYSGSTIPDYSATNSPTGISLSPDTNAKSVTITGSNAATVTSFELKATVGTAQAVPATVQVLTAGCTRETGQKTYQYVYNFVPQGQYARLFSTLDDAIQTAGAKFDGSMPGAFGDQIPFQVTELKVGATTYLGGPPATDCAKVDPAIVYVFDSSGGNTVFIAIQVADGKIVALKVSDYQSVRVLYSRFEGPDAHTEGAGASEYRIIDVLSGNAGTRRYTDGGTPSIAAPYPDRMTLIDAGGVDLRLFLPKGAINANLTGTLRYDFPPASGRAPITKQVNLINVADENLPPTLVNPFPDQVISLPGNQFFAYDPRSVFSDSDALTFGVTQTDATALPDGIGFGSNTFSIPGTVPNKQIAIRVTATDIAGQSVYDDFLLTINRNVVTTIASVVIYRDMSDNITFFYRASNSANQYLEDTWTGFDPNYEVWLNSGFTTPPVPGRPAGLETYQYQDPYGNTPGQTAALQSNSTFKIRKRGQTAVLVSVTFTANNLQRGQSKVIFSS